MRSTRTRESRPILLGALLICVTTFTASAANAQDDGAYGFYRTVLGDVRLTTLDRAEPMDVEPDYPLLEGDRLWVAAGGRAEAILPDQTVVRAAGGTDLFFEVLAADSDDAGPTGTVLRLLEGEIQVVLRDSAWQGEPLRVDTANAVAYLERAGVYRIYSDDRQWTEVVVREGFGEVVLAEGSVVVRPNEEAVIEGEVDPRVRVYPAGAIDALEAWGDELDRDAELAASGGYVDESLSYAAAPLRHHGEWLHVDESYAWRPYAAAGWRPYSQGYWTHTPGGYYWVSADPWGGFTSHYGSWRLHSYHGWIWYPGRVFSPAWVTWYWGPTHVGWVPAGYYSHHYRPYGYLTVGLGYGAYGWAGGSWGYYRDWTFCPTRYFGWRSYGSYWRTGVEIGRTANYDVPRGVITGTTRGIPRGFNDRPESVIDYLRRGDTGSNSKLPDVTDFVARQPRLTDEVRARVFAKPGSDRSVINRLTSNEPTRGSSPRVGSPRAEPTRVGAGIRGTARDEPVSVIRSMPARPDVSRREIVTGAPVAREALPRSSGRATTPQRPGEPERRSPSSYVSGREPVRVSPSEDSRSTRPSSVTRLLPPRAVDSRPSGAAPSRPVPPSARAMAPAPSGAPGSTGSRVPIVRRILDGIRGVPSTPRSAAPSGVSSSSPPRPTTPPSSTSSRRPSSPPSVARPGSGSAPQSVRKPTPSARPSAPPKRPSRPPAKPPQSPPKSKPPR